MLSRKYYQLIADCIRVASVDLIPYKKIPRSKKLWDKTVQDNADCICDIFIPELQADNHRFDSQRFREACHYK